MREEQSILCCCALIPAVCSFILAGPAVASLYITGGTSEAGLGSFDGVIDFTATGTTTGSLAVTLTNTSSVANSGWLTAFAFNVVDWVTLALSSSAPGGTSW